MEPKTLSNFHRFGKVGRIIVSVLLVLAILTTAVGLTASIYISTLPGDALTVRVTDRAEFRIDENKFAFLWGLLADQFAYAGDADPEGMLGGEGSAMLPPEDQDFQTSLSFFDHSYSSAKIYSDGSARVIEAESVPAEYRSTDLATVLTVLTLLSAAATVALFLLRRLFAVLMKSGSPFCDDLVKGLRAFGFSLLPVALFATIGETLSTVFLSAGRFDGVRLQWGVLLAFAVTMFLVAIFRYGVQLQKESDETL